VRAVESALVLGGGGFIGRSLVRELRARGVRVVVLTRSGPPETGVEWLTTDLASVDVGRIATERRVDTVFDLAGSADAPGSLRAPLDDLESNAGQTLRTLESLRGVPTPPVYVYGSSAAVYGRVSRVPIEEGDLPRPLSPYAVSKLTAEKYVSLYQRVHGQPAMSLRLFSVYGPGQRKQAIFDLMLQARTSGDALRVNAPADVTRDFIFIKDVVNATIALAERAPAEGEIYNVASGHEISMDELAKAILVASGARKVVTFGDSLRPGDPHRYVGATDRIAALGVHLDTPLGVGLAQTAEWIRGPERRRARYTGRWAVRAAES
jgi:nucleoside-diphosphate-sugar epimerase